MDGRFDAAARQATRLDAIKGRFDPWLLACMLALAAFGLVMVASSSLAVADSRGLPPLHYFHRHAAYLAAGIALAGLVMAKGDVRRVEQYGRILPLLGVLLLLLVLIPGLGHTVKGARRWINFGPIGFQPAEAVKLIVIVWLASYLARFSDEVKGSWASMFKAFGIALALSVILLLVHKDFGTSALVLAITAGMMVLGGVHLPRMILPVLGLMPLVVGMILMEPYRVQRMISFSDPWKDPFGSGYQLTNALMAVGRGEFWGVGLGGSVQKLSYLPEAYTDFIMAVIAEELGFVGVCLVVALYVLLVGRMFWLGLQCVDMRRNFSGYLAFGIGLWIAMQAFVSIGVNLGILPTKGLTLPLVSSGGSSILVTCVAFGLLLRISWELERAKRQVALRREAMPVAPAVQPVAPSAAPSATDRPGRVARAVRHEYAAHLRMALAKLFERPRTGLRAARIEPSFGGTSGQ
ncbi:putative lipid II flippase FtsW [Lysobacter pythonis]|uniref:Probable peptidoglycan glycosyltransferase FtsW n=1 Tax=Solilutibacter pythonis TaxID=2483112 RepID=A0A3M2I6W3_9GAMM|nr:putative lipid II flippase FtsW [Lysobacter pythonis]RMH94197.1 putative lipid II flippase FtsW [Lysobacter pythonis]